MLTGGVALTFDLHSMHHILKAYQCVAAPRPYDNQSTTTIYTTTYNREDKLNCFVGGAVSFTQVAKWRVRTDSGAVCQTIWIVHLLKKKWWL